MEKFFYIIKGPSVSEIKEFIYRRYHDVSLIMHMGVCDFAEFIRIGREKEQEERLHAQWVTMLPMMSLKQLKYISFEEYVNQCTGKNIDLRPAEEIIKELEELHGHSIN